MITEAVIVALITGAFSFLGVLVANNKQQGVILEKIDQLEKKADKHNSIVEKVYNLESDIKIITNEIGTIKRKN